MPQSIPPRRRWRLIVILIIVAFISVRTALSYYVDVLWYRSLGYGDVFWKTRSLRWAVCAAFTAVTFIILYGSFLALKRASLAALPASAQLSSADSRCYCRCRPSCASSGLALRFSLPF